MTKTFFKWILSGPMSEGKILLRITATLTRLYQRYSAWRSVRSLWSPCCGANMSQNMPGNKKGDERRQLPWVLSAMDGAEAAWHTSSSDTLSPPSFPSGSDRPHESPSAQWGVDSHLTTPHLRDLYHALPPTGDNHLIANSPTGDANTLRTQKDMQKDTQAHSDLQKVKLDALKKIIT